MTSAPDPTRLRREIGLGGAVLLGLGSMVGTGVFVSLGLAAEHAGAALLLAVVIAAVVATANGLSSAQLAAAHPVSGGTYEYGYRWLGPSLGFTAGWMFLLAKSASAATAALGVIGYGLGLAGVDPGARHGPLAALVALAVTAFVAGGIRRSNRGNAVVVAVTLLGLGALVLAALPSLVDGGVAPVEAARTVGVPGLLEGAALVFVAFTGYGRIATLGEEVRDPARVIPRAVIVTMAVVTLLYFAVAASGVAVLGAEGFAASARTTAAPLEEAARILGVRGLPHLVGIAAVTAMVGVLLNLVLGLSRVLLAMARRGDAPAGVAVVDEARSSPVAAVWACGVAVAGIALVGDVRTTWSFSAFTVLVYYSITNLAALRLGASERRYPRWIPALGLVACLTLAFRVELRVWVFGVALLAAGLVGHVVRRRRT